MFEQDDFSGPADGFADEAMVYVPQSCLDQRGCRIHIALHGCEQSRETIGDTFIRESGFAAIADKLAAIGPLADNGVIWVLTPKTGRSGHVEPSEIAEAALTAGLSQTSNATVSDGWAGSRLVAPKAGKSRR